jgi:hypothetical protein
MWSPLSNFREGSGGELKGEGDLGCSLIYPPIYDKFAPESINPEHRWLFNVEL